MLCSRYLAKHRILASTRASWRGQKIASTKLEKAYETTLSVALGIVE